MVVMIRIPNMTELHVQRNGPCIVCSTSPRRVLNLLLWCLATAVPAAAQTPGIDFFESKIRPLLIEHCYSCHSTKAEKLEAGLHLDHRAGLLTGGDSGPAIVPGKPEESLLIRAVRYEEYEMPPQGRLADEEIKLLVQWVALGAPFPQHQTPATTSAPGGYDWDHFRTEHWSFRPIENPAPPPVANIDWPQNSVDRFILARLEAASLSPGAPAASRVLVRRIYLDLTGLPPTAEEVATFVRAAEQNRPLAVSKLVDRLLASPRYGERWGRHWLDVARFSDGLGGFTNSRDNYEAWRYRDWVIEAFNQDQPYDEFVNLQIAGDLRGSGEAAIATGFFALGPVYKSDGGDPDSIAQSKSETLDDRVDTLSRGLLGLTASCARCHDHKFDPIPQQDYYSMAGVFNNTDIHDVPLVSKEAAAVWDRQAKAIEDLKKQIEALKKRARKEKRALTEDEQAQTEQWNTQLRQRQKSLPTKYPTAHVLRDTGSGNMKVAIRGNLRKPGVEAPRRFLRIIAGDDRLEFSEDGSGRRELADAVSSSSNPLTARVIVNRIWMHHFGEALVRSPSNFGMVGELPTHPLLLDWLASEFLRSGWSIKSLHRTILMSATWQQSTAVDQQKFEVDGDNRLVWRMNPRRMDVEVWRDSLLFVTGELDVTPGGSPFDDPAANSRRTLYARVSRNGDQTTADAFLRLFDFPLMRATIDQRPTSVVPQQFLFMMNSQFMVDRSRALAQRLEALSGDTKTRIQQAYALLFGRQPSTEELKVASTFLSGLPSSSEEDDSRLPVLVQYAQALLSSNEFMYVR